MSGLSRFQVEIAEMFFSLPASKGFLLAGGGALLASGLTSRPTFDLDFFGDRRRVKILDAANQFEAAATRRGWTIERVQVEATFIRLRVTADTELIVDLAIDSPPSRKPVQSVAGPTFDPEELAGRKLGALFDRAEARDFVDVYTLALRFGRKLLLESAAEADIGFTTDVLAEMMATLERFEDSELPISPFEVGALRAYFVEWSSQLRDERM